jgi:hypothetical protein
MDPESAEERTVTVTTTCTQETPEASFGPLVKDLNNIWETAIKPFFRQVDRQAYEALRGLARPGDVLAALAARGWLDPDRKDGLAQTARDLAALHQAANAAVPELGQ